MRKHIPDSSHPTHHDRGPGRKTVHEQISSEGAPTLAANTLPLRYRGKLQWGGDGDLTQQAGTVLGLSFCESISHPVTICHPE